ncbi:MAG: DUF2231 domain-containing protein [Actinomycetota bacterium]|nr:DUF2231 domain-containing protein [Actinomycetota bacterium]
MSALMHGTKGHPLHPPLTGVVIGMYSLATGLGVVGALGGVPEKAAVGMWLALVGGLIATVPTALTGLLDWLTISRDTPVWRTATLHMAVMLSATGLFVVSAWLQYRGYEHAYVRNAALATTLVGFVLLSTGGWLGGAIVYVHGMRVLGLPELPTSRTVSPTSDEPPAS